MLVCLFSLRLSARCAWSGCVFGALSCLFSWGLTVFRLIVARLIVGYFQEERGAVKGERKEMVGERVQMCVGVVVGVVGLRSVVRRFVSTCIALRGWFLSNVAETRGFYSAGFLSGFGSSAEPVVHSRATHNGVNLGERRVGVKGILFSPRVICPRVIWSGELQGEDRYDRY